jgi:hypothetical protein
MDLKGSGESENLCHPVASRAAGSDSLYIELGSSQGLDLEAWRPGGLDAGCWQDWKWVAARWEERLEGSPHTLDAPGGRR